MLYIVLALVLAAFGLLIAALTTANTVWAWISVTISVVAAVMLIADWVGARRRSGRSEPAAASRAAAPATAAATTRAPLAEPPLAARSDTFEPVRRVEQPEPGDSPAERTVRQPAVVPPAEQPALADQDADQDAEQATRTAPPVPPPPARRDPPEQPEAHRAVQPPPPDEEPAEEPTDAADLLVVSELTVEVRVVDEHPRYHLTTCAWLTDKATLPLPVNEARQLGFTPCSYCGPDAILAARHRAAR